MLARIPLPRAAVDLGLLAGAALAAFVLFGRAGGDGSRRPSLAAAAAIAAPLTLLADAHDMRETIAGMPVVWAAPPQGEPRGVVLLFHG